MRTYNFTLSSSQEGQLPIILDHYLFYDPVYGQNFTYPSSAWGKYFFNATEMPAEATAYFSRVPNIQATQQQIIGEFIYQLKKENLWDSLVDGWLLRKDLNAGTGTTVYALKNNSDNGVFGPGVNGKLPTWEHNGVRFYNDGIGPAGLGPRISVPNWTHQVSAPMSIFTVFSPFSAALPTGSGVFGQTSRGGGTGQHFGINYDTQGSSVGQIALYVGNNNIDAAMDVKGIAPLSGNHYIMTGAVTTGTYFSGGIDSLPLPTNSIGGSGATTALTAVAIGYELSGGSGFQNAYPYDGLINAGFVFNKAIDCRKFYEIYSCTVGVTVPMSPVLNPNITWDLDAYAYMLRVGINGISDADKIRINDFIKGSKTLGVWNNMICWPMRSGQNKGSGLSVASFGGYGIYDGILEGATASSLPTWSSNGIVFPGSKYTKSTSTYTPQSWMRSQPFLFNTSCTFFSIINMDASLDKTQWSDPLSALRGNISFSSPVIMSTLPANGTPIYQFSRRVALNRQAYYTPPSTSRYGVIISPGYDDGSGTVQRAQSVGPVCDSDNNQWAAAGMSFSPGSQLYTRNGGNVTTGNLTFNPSFPIINEPYQLYVSGIQREWYDAFCGTGAAFFWFNRFLSQTEHANFYNLYKTTIGAGLGLP